MENARCRLSRALEKSRILLVMLSSPGRPGGEINQRIGPTGLFREPRGLGTGTRSPRGGIGTLGEIKVCDDWAQQFSTTRYDSAGAPLVALLSQGIISYRESRLAGHHLPVQSRCGVVAGGISRRFLKTARGTVPAPRCRFRSEPLKCRSEVCSVPSAKT